MTTFDKTGLFQRFPSPLLTDKCAQRPNIVIKVMRDNGN